MKHATLILLALMLGLLAAPALAQANDSLVDRLAADSSGQFTTLVAALEAAGLAEKLSAEGDYTVFAPTNDAFDTAAESLGLSLAELMGDRGMLTQILTYHVVADDRVFFREFSRNPALATLEGSDLALELSQGAPLVNGVTFSGVDRAAGNGVYHVIDAVLLPPDLAAALPEATEAAEMDDVAATAEATEVALDENTAMLRFAFFSPDSPPLVMTINGEPAGNGEALTPPEVSAWMAVPAGTMTISGVPEGEGMEALLFPFELTLDDGTWTTLAVVGSEPNGTFLAQPVLEDYSPIADGNTRATVFHGIEGAPPVDLTGDRQMLVSRLAYPGTRGDNDGAFVIEAPAGSRDLQVILSGTGAGTGAGTVVLVNLPGFEFVEDTNLFIAVVGTRDEPEVLVETVAMSELSPLGQ